MTGHTPPTTNRHSRPRVLAVHPYWGFWESAYRGDLRADKVLLLERATAALLDVEVVARVLAPHGTEVAQICDVAAEAMLIVQSMAVPPVSTLELLARVPRLPVVIWSAQHKGILSDQFDHTSITEEGATVGTPQLINLLHREQRPYRLIVGRVDDPGCAMSVSKALCAAAAAARIQRARLGRVGRPLEGYRCVDVEDGELQRALGIATVPIAPEELRQLYLSVDEAQVETLIEEIRKDFHVSPALAGTVALQRSAKLAVALQQLDEQHELAMGAMNCHVPAIRFAEDPGITPCFALGRETSRGIPWSCTGDVLAPIAMLASKLISGVAVYQEIETLDEQTNVALIANSGEHDLAWRRDDAKPILHANPWFSRDALCGACACFTPSAGPATLVAFTPSPEERSGFRFVVAEGELTSRSFPRTGTINGAFRFAAPGPVAQIWVRWAETGVNHHSCLTRGHIAEQIQTVARFLGVGCIHIS